MSFLFKLIKCCLCRSTVPYLEIKVSPNSCCKCVFCGHLASVYSGKPLWGWVIQTSWHVTFYFRQNAGAGREELKIEGGYISMIADVFIHCKYQTNEKMWCWFDHMISVNVLDGSNPDRRGFNKKKSYAWDMPKICLIVID